MIPIQAEVSRFFNSEEFDGQLLDIFVIQFLFGAKKYEPVFGKPVFDRYLTCWIGI